MNDNLSILSAENNGKSIIVEWSDGEKSKFNFCYP